MRLYSDDLIVKDIDVPSGAKGDKAGAVFLAVPVTDSDAGKDFLVTLAVNLNNPRKGWFARDMLIGAGIFAMKERPTKKIWSGNPGRVILPVNGANVAAKRHHEPIVYTIAGTIKEGEKHIVAFARGNVRGGLFGWGSKPSGRIEIGGGAFLQVDMF